MLSARSTNAATRKPNTEEPVSPMKIFAGGKLKRRKPAQAAPITMKLAAKATLFTRKARSAQATQPMTPMPPAKPSMPSMKLYRLVSQTTNKTVNRKLPTGASTNSMPGSNSLWAPSPASTRPAAAATCTSMRTQTRVPRISSRIEISRISAAQAATGARSRSRSPNAPSTAWPEASPATMANPPVRVVGVSCSERSFGWSSSAGQRPDASQRVISQAVASASRPAAPTNIMWCLSGSTLGVRPSSPARHREAEKRSNLYSTRTRARSSHFTIAHCDSIRRWKANCYYACKYRRVVRLQPAK